MQEGSGRSQVRNQEAEEEGNAQAKKQEKAFIIGGGTSAKVILDDPALRSAMCEYTVMGCNKAVEHIDCDIMVIHDHFNFINSKYQHLLDQFDGGGGIYAPSVSNTDFQGAKGVTYLKRSATPSYDLASGVFAGGNCGCLALSLAVALKFKEIYLIGMDARFNKDMTRSHFHEGYGHERMTERGERVYEAFATVFENNGSKLKKLRPSVKVFNCSYVSYIDVEEKYFRRVDIRDVLNGRTDVDIMNREFWERIGKSGGDLEKCQTL